MDPFNAMRENEKGLLSLGRHRKICEVARKLMILQPPILLEETAGEATVCLKLNMPSLLRLDSLKFLSKL